MATIHPARKMVESLHAKGACPRIQVDLLNEDVVCPDFVKEKWKDKLVIDLDPSYPLNLGFTELGIEADLSFGGIVTRCVFPFDAIFVVVDRETGKGIRLDGPETQQRDREVEAAARRAAEKTARKKGSRRRRRRAKDEGELPAGPKVAEAGVAEPAEPTEPAAATEEEAQRRRAVFKVIDGEG
jgi:stringent starvation protein B